MNFYRSLLTTKYNIDSSVNHVVVTVSYTAVPLVVVVSAWFIRFVLYLTISCISVHL